MAWLWFSLYVALLLVLAVLALAKKIELLRGVPLVILLVAAPNLVALAGWGLNTPLLSFFGGFQTAAVVLFIIFAGVLWLKLNLAPVRTGRRASLRLRLMFAGRKIGNCGVAALLLNAFFVPLTWLPLARSGMPGGLLVTSAVVCAVLVFGMLANGMLRMVALSRRLGIVPRLALLFTWYIPVVNFFTFRAAGGRVRDEYDFALHKQDLHLTRVDSDICATRYPLVMVHGVLFRDLKHFNYWGRIPRELIRYGAKVYYGNQEAVGTIERNAADLVARVEQLMAETGAEKVNIIAHSKGGLDARYAITALGLSDRVASLTTISTPHQGCKFVDQACKLPEWLFRGIAKFMDGSFRRIGDRDPDFYAAIHEFQTSASAEFNRRVPDMPGVYYQSYMTRMNGRRGDPMLALPYSLIKPLEGHNDGLVAVPSAQWGNFRQLFVSTGRRGISHGDIIDLKREDYKGFDVVETYVSMVADLKAMGY